MKTTATLAGVPLQGTVSWTLAPGVAPYTGVFQMTTADANNILDRWLGQPVTLEIRSDGDNQRDLTVEHLYVMQVAEATAPYLRRVVVVDRRWFWSRKHIRHAFNVRRRIGTQRLRGERPETVVTIPGVSFLPPTMRSPQGSEEVPQPWTYAEVLSLVLDEVAGPLNWRSVGLDLNALNKVRVENLVVNAPGDAAVAQVMGLAPSLAIYQGIDGLAVLYDRWGGGERRLVARAGPVAVDSGWAVRTSRRHLRARKLRVLFERECEVRFEFNEGFDVDELPERSRRYLENVLPCPDHQLTLQDGTVASRGQWITFDQAIWAWVNDAVPLRTVGGEDISHEKIQELFLSSVFQLAFVQGSGTLGSSDEILQRRIDAILAHYRQTFRIRREWMNRIRSLSANRLAVYDTATGQRAEAVWYGGYAVQPTHRRVIESRMGINDPNRLLVFGNVSGYAAQLVDARPAPAEISILDEELGVLHVSYRGSPYGGTARIVPCRLADGKNVSLDVITETKALIIDYAELESGYQAATVLSITPFGPNDVRQLHAEEVTPDDVQAATGGSVGRCDGPTLDIYVSLLTARFAWLDEEATTIERMVFEGVQPLSADEANEQQNKNKNAR